MAEIRKADQIKDALAYVDGPWSNNACKGYAILAMQRAGLSEALIKEVSLQMSDCFEDMTVDEAADFYMGGGVF